MDIDRVRSFWEKNPLWTGETKHTVGSWEFFEEHRNVYFTDCFAGVLDPRCFPPPRREGQAMKVLDLGCGIGFWVVELGMHGLNNIVGADLTTKALEITRQRCQFYGIQAGLQQENAEQMSFADNSLDHVNCQGVLHHTPNIDNALSEIARVLKPGGTACISVYYRNVLLRLWPCLRWLGYPLAKLGGGLKGRGREAILKEADVDEIVRMYDGFANPIGKSYTQKQFERMLAPFFSVEEIYFHFFPARAMPFPLPKRVHRWLDKHVPFMIYANLKKVCVE